MSPTVTDLPAVLLARAYLAAGVPLSLLVDLAASAHLDSTEILAVEQATAMAAAAGTFRRPDPDYRACSNHRGAGGALGGTNSPEANNDIA